MTIVWVPNAMLHNALSIGKKTSKIASSPWYFVTPPEEDRATAIGNTHKHLVKIARVVLEICSRTDRPTHTHTDVLITILRPGFRGQKGKGNEGIFTTLFILCMYISKRSDMDHTVLPANYTIPCDFCICVFRYSYLINYLYHHHHHHHHHHHQVIYSAPTINVGRRCITMSNIKIVKNK